MTGGPSGVQIECHVADKELFVRLYNVQMSGNCHLSPLSDPQGEFRGKNVLRQPFPHDSLSAADQQQLGGDRRTLHGVRKQRPRPPLDDKVGGGVDEGGSQVGGRG